MPLSPRFRQPLILCLALLPVFAAARDQTQSPTPYGLKYVRAAVLVAPQAQPQLLRSAPEAQRYRGEVEQAEHAQGPYSPRLGELLVEEAGYLQQRGNYEAAIASLRRAVHVTRINDGLHSALQEPLVRRLRNNYLAIGDLEMADDAQQYLYFLAGESHADLSAEKVAAAIALADWQRRTWLIELHDHNYKLLYQSYRLLGDLYDELHEAGQPALELLEDLTYAHLRQLYLLEEEDFGPTDELQLSLNRGFADEQTQQLSHEERQLQYLQKGAYSRGRKLLENLAQKLEKVGNREGQARARLYLADWHLWHNRKSRAAEDYRACWRLLAAPGLGYLRDDWLGEPRELPVDEVFFPGMELLPRSVEKIPVAVRFALTESGRPAEVEILELAEEHEGTGYGLRRWLRAARYRPLIREGELAPVGLLERRYVVLDY